METILENRKTACIRLDVPIEQHESAHSIKRAIAQKNNRDVTVLNIYLQAVEIGLKQLAKEAA